MGKKKKNRLMPTCACGFINARTSIIGAECPMCHTKMKFRKIKRRVFTEYNRDEIVDIVMKSRKNPLIRKDVIGGMGGPNPSPSRQNPKPMFPSKAFEESGEAFMEFKNLVLENARIEYSNGYDFTTLQSPKRDRAAAYVKAMKRKRLVLFEYEPAQYERFEKKVKVEDPYKPKAKTASFDIEESQRLILGVGEVEPPKDEEALTPSQLRAYEENYKHIISTGPMQMKTNAGRCSAKKSSIYEPEIIEALESGPVAIKKLLNTNDNIRWTRFGELVLFSRTCPFVELEALIVVQGARYPKEKESTMNCVMRVRVKSGIAQIWFESGELTSNHYTMGENELKIWASEICYVLTPLIPKNEHRRYMNGLVSSDPMDMFSDLGKVPGVTVHGTREYSEDVSTVHVPEVHTDSDPIPDEEFEDDAKDDEPEYLSSVDESATTRAYACENDDGICNYLLFDWVGVDNIFTWTLYDTSFKVVDLGSTIGDIDPEKLMSVIEDVSFEHEECMVFALIETDWLMDRVMNNSLDIVIASCAAYELKDEKGYLRITRDRLGEYKWYHFDQCYKFVDSGFVNNVGNIMNAGKHILSMLNFTSKHVYNPIDVEFKVLCKKIAEANDGKY